MIEKKEIIKSLEETTEKVQKMPRAEFIKKLKPLWGDEHDPCGHCSANPKNGGSGLCNCTLCCPKIT